MPLRLITTVIVVTILSLTTVAADAKRLGGGRSIGKQQTMIAPREAPPAGQAGAKQGAQGKEAARPTAATAPAPSSTSGRSRWLGPLAGMAAGLSIAALLGHLGLGAELAATVADMILAALLVFAFWFIWRMLRARAAPARHEPAYARSGLSGDAVNALGRESDVFPHTSAIRSIETSPKESSESGSEPGISRPAVAPGALAIPAGFDVEAFVRQAKVYFVRLQEAWDAGNLNDIREFTCPGLFDEIRSQLAGRGSAENRTDVVTLEAEVLGVHTGAEEHLVSVRFHGLIREHAGGAAEPFDEVWNLTKPVARPGGWVLAGIQQIETEPVYQMYA